MGGMHANKRLAGLLLSAAVLLCVPWQSALAQTCSSPTVSIPDEPVPLIGAPTVRATAAPGTLTEQNASAVIDYSNAKDGYVMVKYTGNAAKIKLQLTGGNQVTYTYSLNKGRGFEAFPLTSGTGNYTVNVYENVRGQQYALALGKTFHAQIDDPFAPYLRPSQYVNYTASSQTVALGAQLASGAGSDLEALQRIYNWVIGNIAYDTPKAQSVKSGYLPEVDTIISTRKGICFDYAAVLATMLRTQNIPTRVEVGYVSTGAYHAWVSVYLKDQGWVNGIIQFDGQNWKLMDPTFAAESGGSESIMSFINNTSNYKKSYVY